MDLVSSLSPTLWDLLQRTRLRPDLALELFDENLNPLLSGSEDRRTTALRRAASIRFCAGIELSFRTVLQAGREARISIDEFDVTLLPVRDQQPVGLLAAITPRASESSTEEWVTPGPAEAAARAWRDAIEGDLVSTRRLRNQEGLAYRSRALATFVADLQQSSDEFELLNALLQAIAVWHDVEPCSYSRDLAGHFELRTTLPGTDASALPKTLEAGAVIDVTAHRTGEWPVLTQLGWPSRGTPLLLLVSSGSLEEWLIAISGTHDADLTKQLQPMLRGFSAAIERVREREARQLRQQLWDAIVGWSDPSDLPGLGCELMKVVSRAVNATHGVLAVGSEVDVPASAGALVAGQTDSTYLVREGYFTADSLRISLPLGGGRAASMELRRSDGGWFRPQDVTTFLAMRPLLGAWLAAVQDRGEWHATVALAEVSRVLRFSDTGASARV